MASVAELILSVVGKDEASAVLNGIGEAGTGLGTKVTAGAGVAVAAAAGVGVAFLGISNDMHKANNEFQVQLGATGAQADRLGEVAKRVYLDNFAGSIEEAAGVIATSFKVIGDVGDEELQSITENALRLQDSFGIDTAESIDAAKTLMENFGLSSEEAFDFVTTGLQEGLNRSGDFLDTIGEYSTQFENGGASANQFFSLMKTGLQGGMLGTDKAADAFKEFRVRIQDGSKATATALDQLGIDFVDFTDKLSTGELTAADAFDIVTSKLREQTDETIKMQAGVGLLGTQFEDLGQSGIDAIDLWSTSTSELAGSTASLDEKYDTLGSRIEGLKRKAEVGLLPMAEHLQTVLPVAGQLGMAFSGLMPVIGAVGPAFTLMSGVAVKALMAMGTAMLTPPLGFVVALVAAGVAIYVFRDEIKAGLGAAADFVTGIAPKIGGAITGALGDVLEFGADHWPEIATLLSGPFMPLVAVATDAFGVRTALTDGLGDVLEFGADHWPEIATLISGPFMPLVAVATDAFGVRTALKNAFGGMVGTAGEKMGEFFNIVAGGGERAKDAFIGSIGAMVGWVRDAFNDLIGGINWVIGQINSALEFSVSIPGVDMPDPIPNIPGVSFSFDAKDIGSIPYLAEGGIVRARPGGTLVNVGEGGRDEAVIPLDGRFRGGGGNNYHFYRPVQIVLPNARSADDIMRELDRVLPW
ncbi:MAG: phage tail tape measure protein [Dehalococcoidia bacterium]